MAKGSLSQKLKSAAAGVISATLLATSFSAAAQANQNIAPPSGAALYVLDNTLHKFGPTLNEHILKWANQNRYGDKPVVVTVLSAHDFEGPQTADQIWDNLPQALKDSVERAGRSYASIFKARHLYAIQKNIPLATPVPVKDSDAVSHCVINLPKSEAKPLWYAKIASHDFDHQMKRAYAGSAQAWLAMLASHEAVHCGHSPSLIYNQASITKLINHETEADNKGMQQLYDDWQNLFPYDTLRDRETFFASYMASRASNTLRNPQHATFAGLVFPHNDSSKLPSRPSFAVTTSEIVAARLDIEAKIIAKAGKLPRNYADMYHVVVELLKEGAFAQSTLQTHIIKAYVDGTHKFFPEVLGIAETARLESPQP